MTDEPRETALARTDTITRTSDETAQPPAPRRRVGALLGIALTFLCGVALSSVSTGCYDCAEYGEYCTDLDCCDDLACQFDETEGYRCR